jgi:O-antigen/teichoic acid export membrane protein
LVSHQSRLSKLISSGGSIAAAMAVMNVAMYAFTILSARMLGPVQYGALAAILGLLVVLNVVSLGLQATGARRVAADPAQRPAIERAVLRATYVCALTLGVLALLASPLVSQGLELDSWAIAALIAVTVVPITVMGGQAGLFQGERLWTPLALIYLSSGLGRLAFGGLGLAMTGDALGAMVGVALGAVLPVVIGWFALRSHARRTDAETTETSHRVLGETLHNSHALLAFFALSNADVVLARAVLDDHQAGLYAGGLILTKAVLFLPQFVIVVAFPSMSRGGSSRLTAIALSMVAGIGLATVAGVAVLQDIALWFVGGPEYAEVKSLLWAFAALGTILAMMQMMVYGIVARQRQRAVYLIWAAVLGVTVVALIADSATELLVSVSAVDVALLVLLIVAARRRDDTPDSAGAEHHQLSAGEATRS